MSACGHQVTPSLSGTTPGSGLPAGFMQVKFQVAQPFNFNNYSYSIVFNTSGDGKTPLANAVSNGYAGYSFVIVVSGSSPTATAYIYNRPVPNVAPVLQQIQFVPQDLRLVSVNSNGINTQFTVLFNRSLASAFATPSPTPSASASPTASPTGSSSPSPTPSPSPLIATSWNFNFFVTAGQFGSGSSTLVDSLGHNPTGATDTSFSSATLNTLTAFDINVQPLVGIPPADPSSQIFSGEISNNP